MKDKYKNTFQIPRREKKWAATPHSDPCVCSWICAAQETTGLLIIWEKESVLSTGCVLSHFASLMFQCPSFMFLSFLGQGLSILQDYTWPNSLDFGWRITFEFVRFKGQGCSLLISQSPSKCLSHENMLESLAFCTAACSVMDAELCHCLGFLTPDSIQKRATAGPSFVNDNPEFWKLLEP
jgi:hypothetical protein